MGDRCTGHCCQNFYLPLSPDDLERGYTRWKNGGQPLSMNGAEAGSIYQDIHLIAPMVVYLGKQPSGKRVNPSDEALLGKPEILSHRYRCKHFDAGKKVCTIYEIRPQMCRDYPGGRGQGTCDFAKCTWDARKTPKQTKKDRNRRLKILGGSGGLVSKTAAKMSGG